MKNHITVKQVLESGYRDKTDGKLDRRIFEKDVCSQGKLKYIIRLCYVPGGYSSIEWGAKAHLHSGYYGKYDLTLPIEGPQIDSPLTLTEVEAFFEHAYEKFGCVPMSDPDESL
jgi:hypothetical protein